jgi:hypothetical protein
VHEPAGDTPPGVDEETGEVFERRPFAAWLQEQRQGGLHSELSDALAEVVQAVVDHEKPGTVQLTVTVKPSEMDGAVVVSDKVVAKPPEPEKGASLFFSDSRGNLSRRDPRQQELPLREVGGGADERS